MTATAWRRALRFRVTVKRNTTSVSASGSTKFAYSTVATGLACSLQDAKGRMTQDEVGQVPDRKKRALFGAEAMGVLQQNDILVIESGAEIGSIYKVLHLHDMPDPNAPNVKADLEQWVPSGAL